MKVEIYGRDNCPYCVKAKEACEAAKIPYTFTKVGAGEGTVTKAHVQARIDAGGHAHEMKTVPQIFVDDKWIGGYDNLVASYPWAKIYHESKNKK
jgi:glutaredoxin